MSMALYWVGGMKFFEFEAKGIEGLVSASPFMSWLYDLFSIQVASNVIGTYDILFAIILGVAIYLRYNLLMLLSGLACGAVFVMTQTFLISSNGFSAQTLINGLGQFVIKDLWYVANLLVIAYFIRNTQQSSK